VFRREDDEVRAVDRVDPCREDFDVAATSFERKADARAFGPADPVALHGQDLLGPLAEFLHSVQQLVAVMRDLEEPLLQVARRHRRAAAPATAVHHLLVGQDGVTTRAPVDARPLAVGQAPLEHLQEQPLVPLVVVGQAGRDLALPGVADAQALQLPFHVGDVLDRPRLGMRSIFDRRVLRRQAERVPPERVQHVEAAHPLHPRDDIADRVIPDVSHVRVSRGVREHLEAVELGLVRILADFERTRGAPAFLPLGFDCLGFVLRHDP
jgi:hypothetical protein